MKSLEVITVIIANRYELENVIEYCARFFDTIREGEKNYLSAYRSADHASGLSVHIRCQLDPPETGKSLLGLQLARGLRDFGIVSHTLWIEQTESCLSKT